MITKKEIAQLVRALQTSQDGKVTQEQCLKLIEWAQQAKINYATLCNVLNGTVEVNVLDGEVVFRGDGMIRAIKKSGKKAMRKQSV